MVEAPLGRQSGERVHWRFRDVLRSLIQSELESLGVPRAVLSSGAHSITGGTAEVLMGWIEHPQRVSAEQISRELRRYALRVTRLLKKG